MEGGFCIEGSGPPYIEFIEDGMNGMDVGAAIHTNIDITNWISLDGAALLGKIAAEKAKAIKISEVVFDRSGFAYHGRVKAIAEAARKNGLKF